MVTFGDLKRAGHALQLTPHHSGSIPNIISRPNDGPTISRSISGWAWTFTVVNARRAGSAVTSALTLSMISLMVVHTMTLELDGASDSSGICKTTETRAGARQ